MKKQSEQEKTLSPKIAKALSRLQLRYTTLEGTAEVFNCLQLLTGRNAEALVIDNTQNINQMLLLKQSHPVFAIGIDCDDVITSRGIFGSSRGRGNDHALISDRFTLLFANKAKAAAFQKLFNQSKATYYA